MPRPSPWRRPASGATPEGTSSPDPDSSASTLPPAGPSAWESARTSTCASTRPTCSTTWSSTTGIPRSATRSSASPPAPMPCGLSMRLCDSTSKPMRSILAALLVTATFLGWLLVATAQQQTNAPLTVKGGVKFEANATLVIEIVNVRDKDGNPIKGLQAKDFTVTEDGKPQEVRICDFQELQSAPAPLEQLK